MKQYIVWLKTEYKRAAHVLPGLFLKAIIPLVFFGMILSYAQKNDEYSAVQKGLIGVSAQDGTATQLALNFVESMDAITNNFHLVRVEEHEILDKIRSEELQVGVSVPEEVLSKILYGEEVRISLYLPKSEDIGSMIFSEVLKAGMDVLVMAQGEIYTTRAIVDKYGISAAYLEDMYEDINRTNLNVYLNREQYFRKRQMSVTDNSGYVRYYAAAFFTLYCLLFPLLVTGYAKRTEEEEVVLKKRLGIPYTLQYLGRMQVLFTLFLLPAALYFGLLAFPLFFKGMRFKLSLGMVLTVLLILLFGALWAQLLYVFAENKRAVLLPTVVAALLFGYLSGCILPYSVLPNVIKRIAGLLPFSSVRILMLDAVSGQGMRAGEIGKLLLWTLLLFAAGVAALCLKAARFGGEKKIAGAGEHGGAGAFSAADAAKKHALPAGGNLFFITFKRTLRTKSLWICLLLTIGLSVLLKGMERKSEITLKAAVYCEDAALRDQLAKSEGLVEFILLDSKEAVTETVLLNRAECGYIIGEDAREKILSEEGDWCISVYESPGATLTDVVSEALFAKMFYLISADWYENYLCGHEVFSELSKNLGTKAFLEEIRSTLYEEMHFGQTMFVETYYVGDERVETDLNVSFYPGKILAALCLLLCVLTGVLQVLADKAARRTYKHNPTLVSLFTVLHPTLLGIITAILIFYS